MYNDIEDIRSLRSSYSSAEDNEELLEIYKKIKRFEFNDDVIEENSLYKIDYKNGVVSGKFKDLFYLLIFSFFSVYLVALFLPNPIVSIILMFMSFLSILILYTVSFAEKGCRVFASNIYSGNLTEKEKQVIYVDPKEELQELEEDIRKDLIDHLIDSE